MGPQKLQQTQKAWQALLFLEHNFSPGEPRNSSFPGNFTISYNCQTFITGIQELFGASSSQMQSEQCITFLPVIPNSIYLVFFMTLFLLQRTNMAMCFKKIPKYSSISGNIQAPSNLHSCDDTTMYGVPFKRNSFEFYYSPQ